MEREVLKVNVEFLEPYRVQPWLPKDRRKGNRWERGLGYVRLHRRAEDDLFIPYIPGTLLRSAVLRASEFLLHLSGGIWDGKECCNAALIPEKGSGILTRKAPVIFASKIARIALA